MKIRLTAAVTLLLSASILAFVLIVRPLLLKQPVSPGRLVFTDYATPDHIYTVDVFDLEAHTRTALSYVRESDFWLIDVQHVYASMCFAQNNPMFCSAYVSDIMAPEAIKKFDAIKQVWKADYGPPVWSPDGSHIAFGHVIRGTEDQPLTRFDVLLMDADGTNLVDPTPDEDDNGYYLSWSPNSQQLAFACEAEQNLCIVDTNGDNLKKMDTIPNTRIRDITWSPDGRQIVFSLLDKNLRNAELYLVNVDGSEMHRLLEAGTNFHEHPVWSPDSSMIAFRSDEPPNGSGEIYVIERDGSNLHDLSKSLDGNEFGATWSPDSAKIAFFSSQYTKGMYLYVAQADGTRLEQITDNQTWDLRDAGSPELFWIS